MDILLFLPQCLIYNGPFRELCFFANYCHTGYTPFYSFPPPLSAPCNLILLCTRAPPPRQLTFPLIHSEIPQGVNNCTPVYCHYAASTGLIQLIKVAAANPLTDLGPLSILLLILFIGVPTVVDCVVGNVSRSGEEGEHAVLYLPRLDRFSLRVAQVHTSSISLSVLSLWGSWHGSVARVWILSTACYSQLTNALSQRVSAFTRCGLQAVFFLHSTHDVIQPTEVCHHSFASTVCRNSCGSTASPNKLPISDQRGQQCW